jgi:hypothetical protein
MNRPLKEWITRLENGDYSDMPLFIEDLWDYKLETERFIKSSTDEINKIRIDIEELREG